jgi:hypothetical protein
MVIGPLTAIYLIGWLVTTVGVAAEGRRLRDESRPAPHPLAVAVCAGAIWPLVLVGLAQLGAVVAYVKTQHEADRPTYTLNRNSTTSPSAIT